MAERTTLDIHLTARNHADLVQQTDAIVATYTDLPEVYRHYRVNAEAIDITALDGVWTSAPGHFDADVVVGFEM